MAASVLIEQATLDDIEDLTQLLLLLFDQEADFLPDSSRQDRGLKMILEQPGVGRILVARGPDGNIIGMVNLLFTVSTAEGAMVVLLEDMIVKPEYRRQGIGSLLLQSALTFAEANGYVRITLLTDRINEQAIQFYQRHGFGLSAMVPMRAVLTHNNLSEQPT